MSIIQKKIFLFFLLFDFAICKRKNRIEHVRSYENSLAFENERNLIQFNTIWENVLQLAELLVWEGDWIKARSQYS